MAHRDPSVVPLPGATPPPVGNSHQNGDVIGIFLEASYEILINIVLNGELYGYILQYTCNL